MRDVQAKFHCRHCQAELGTTDGVRLRIACLIDGQARIVTFVDRTKPFCWNCGKLTVWFPRQKLVESVEIISARPVL